MNKIRPIRSFVKRQRKLPPNKQTFFDEAWKVYGLEVEQEQAALKKAFSPDAPVILEIGFGMETTMLDLAKKHPKRNFIGIEVHQPGIVNLITQAQAQQLNNIRIYNEDAVIVLQRCIPNESLEKILILFPDPWPKKRHHKRRLIQPQFVELLQNKLKANGILHIATDWEDYAHHITSVLKNNSALAPLETTDTLPALTDRIPTKFEQRGKNRGHSIFDLIFVRQ